MGIDTIDRTACRSDGVNIKKGVADLKYPICEAVSFRTRGQRETEK